MRALAARVVILKFLSKRKVTFLFILLYPLLISSTAISNAFADSYNWDVSPSSGYQAGDGTWGVDNYWSKDGTTLETWPGEGNNAEFSGSDGTYTITVDGTQSVDTITFSKSGYTLDQGTITTKADNVLGLIVNANATINSTIAAPLGLIKSGTAELILSQNYTGGITVNAGTLTLGGNSLTNGFGSSSSGITINNGAVLKLNVHHRINNDVPILIQSGGTFDMNGNSDIIGTISGAGSIINNNHPEGLQLDLADGTTQIFSGSISGSGGLSLRGTNSTTNAGTLIITGIQAYSGQTGICYSYDTDSNIDQAKVKLVLAGGNNRLSPSTVINFGHKTSTGVTGKLILGNASGPSNQTVSGLTDTSGPGTFYVVGGNTNVSILTVNNSSDYIYNGYIGGPDTNENKIALVK